MAEKVQFEEEEVFEDANETIQISNEMDLPTSIQDAQMALNLFLNNRFNEAKDRMKPWSDCSMYHSLSYATVLYLQAVMTFDPADIERAINSSKQAIVVCNKHRKKISLMASFPMIGSKTNYNIYTDEEIHAELCYAECLLQRALLTFIQDENLISFVKGGLKIRACYQSYKECLKILQSRTAWSSTKDKLHFESGVKLGIGAFNLMISLLPTRILKLLEFVGFSGNKKRGLTELEAGSSPHAGLRAPLSSIILIAYHTVVSYILGTADGDTDVADKTLQPCLKNFPNGALFLFFAGRLQLIKANLDEAVVKFEESIESQEEWRQFHHLCYWELMWCHSFKCDWLMAMKYAERLCKESRWSKATYTYQKASFLAACPDKTEETKQHIEYLYNEVPKLKVRIGGKSLPIEKFAIKKVKRYFAQGNRLVLPALELIYVWNGFSIIGKKKELIEPMLKIVEDTLTEITSNKDSYEYFVDDYSLVLHLKGVCLKYRDQRFQAEQCLREVIENEKKIKQDTYLVPWAHMELALLKIQDGEYTAAKQLLDRAKHHYKGYSLESRLHFRLRSAQHTIRSLISNDDEDSDISHASRDVDNNEDSSEMKDNNVQLLKGNKETLNGTQTPISFY